MFSIFWVILKRITGSCYYQGNNSCRKTSPRNCISELFRKLFYKCWCTMCMRPFAFWSRTHSLIDNVVCIMLRTKLNIPKPLSKHYPQYVCLLAYRLHMIKRPILPTTLLTFCFVVWRISKSVKCYSIVWWWLHVSDIKLYLKCIFIIPLKKTANAM